MHNNALHSALTTIVNNSTTHCSFNQLRAECQALLATPPPSSRLDLTLMRVFASCAAEHHPHACIRHAAHNFLQSNATIEPPIMEAISAAHEMYHTINPPGGWQHVDDLLQACLDSNK